MTTAGHARNPFDDPALASCYEQWYAGTGRHADLLEKDLLGKLLRGLPARAPFSRSVAARVTSRAGLRKADWMP